MNLVELILAFGFIECVILFLYAIRWYIFAFVTMRSSPGNNPREHKNESNSCFVSVLLPIYNEPNVVDRLLKACTAFSSVPFEVIVVDDSNDCVTTEKLDLWRSHPKVKVIHRSSRKGWKGGALNVGIDNISFQSTHVLIFDSDFVPSNDLASRFVAKFDDVVVHDPSVCR